MEWHSEAGRGKRPWAEGIRRGGAVIALAVAAGCATMGGGLTKDTPTDVKAAAVKERSSARWEALIRGDRDAAYAYLTPGTREMITVEQYRKRPQAINIKAAHVEKADCEAETCTVALTLTYDYLPPRGTTRATGVTTYVEETWILEKGQLWFSWRP
jgi:hypothetical protein